MNLIRATEDFTLAGKSYPGFPILLDNEMLSVEPANAFFRYYLMRGAIGSRGTWPSVGRAIYDYFSYLEAHGLCWKDVRSPEEQSLVAAYRDYSLDEVGLARNTVRKYLVFVCAFYTFALRQRWIDALPYSLEEKCVPAADADPLQHLSSAKKSKDGRDVTPKASKALPKFLAKEEVIALLRAASNPHHRMMIRLALQTGLRREEIATFPIAYVIDPDKSGSKTPNARITLNPADGNGMQTKGSKERTITVSRAFLRDLRLYVLHQRGERAQLSAVKHKQLFLTQEGKPFADSGKGISRIVRKIGTKAGLQVWTHMLRHTYATHTLNAMRRSKTDIDPVVFLQRQLGHESILTTIIYLHLIDELADNAVLAYDDELNDWAKESNNG